MGSKRGGRITRELLLGSFNKSTKETKQEKKEKIQVNEHEGKLII